MNTELIAQLEAARAAEKEQALFYRALAAAAEDRGDAELSEKFHELHADEQHHLSRITARLIEIGHTPLDLSHTPSPSPGLDGWAAPTQRRETAEVERYADLVAHNGIDETTRGLLQDILEVERLHAKLLGGKWTMA